jgi:septum formation protein
MFEAGRKRLPLTKEQVNVITKIILASGSPRRAQLLEQAGVSFATVVPDVDESVFEGLPPAEQVTGLSRKKALAVSERSGGLPVVAADTLVALGRHVLGKPADRDEAFRMLRMLSGVWQEVYTGVTVLAGSEIRTGLEVTEVKFRELTDEDIEGYLATGEPMDKAGAYAIQGKGALLVERISGDYCNVVGLPLVRLAGMLAELGIRIPG